MHAALRGANAHPKGRFHGVLSPPQQCRRSSRALRDPNLVAERVPNGHIPALVERGEIHTEAAAFTKPLHGRLVYSAIVGQLGKATNLHLVRRVRPVGLEPTTYGLKVRSSNQLSYRRPTSVACSADMARLSHG